MGKVNKESRPEPREIMTNKEVKVDLENKYDAVAGQSKERQEFLRKNRIDG